jgi:hypothetical protein
VWCSAVLRDAKTVCLQDVFSFPGKYTGNCDLYALRQQHRKSEVTIELQEAAGVVKQHASNFVVDTLQTYHQFYGEV